MGRRARSPVVAAAPASPSWRGPAVLWTGWLLHDLEEIVAFPATSAMLAERLGRPRLRVERDEVALAVALMAVLLGAVAARGAMTCGDSPVYRAVRTGLELHVWTHLGSVVALRRYTGGAITAPTIMLTAARYARARRPIRLAEALGGAAILIPAALACHAAARWIMR